MSKELSPVFVVMRCKGVGKPAAEQIVKGLDQSLVDDLPRLYSERKNVRDLITEGYNGPKPRKPMADKIEQLDSTNESEQPDDS